jgi:3-oxoacyl-[acyl-carrier protein] reductase
MKTSLAGRRALVCGASQGIGRACAEALAGAGASVTVLARQSTSLEAVRASLGDGEHHCLVADLSQWEEAGRIVAEHVAATGPMHILVNNSGGPKAGPAIDAEPEDFLAGLIPHVLGSQVMARALVPGMRSEGYGRIINIVSTSVVTPITGLGVSNVVRGAMGNWMRILASELGPDGITVNNILPGFVGTDRLESLMEGRAKRQGTTAAEVEAAWKSTIPAGRFAEPAEIGAVCAFLASGAASYVSGVNLPVDGARLAAN